MKILRAEHLGMCFGVRDAIAVAHQNALTEPVTILENWCITRSVLAMLRERGIDSQNELCVGHQPDSHGHCAWSFPEGFAENAREGAESSGGDLSACASGRMKLSPI